MRHSILSRFLIVTALCATACGAETGHPGDLAGCYALFDHAGRPASDSLYFAPAYARLETVRRSRARTGMPRSWGVTRLDTARRAMTGNDDQRGFLFWAPDSLSDSVRVMFHTGFSGTEMILGPPAARSDTLRGRAIGHWDFRDDTDEGRVTAVRVPCPAARKEREELAAAR